MLKVAATAYRAPSINWFIREMIVCMLNPARWAEFNARLVGGSEQLALQMGDEAQTKVRAKLRRGRKGGKRARP